MSVRGHFDEFSIGTLTARNRFVRAATYEKAADAQDGVTPELIRICRALYPCGSVPAILRAAHRPAFPHAGRSGVSVPPSASG